MNKNLIVKLFKYFIGLTAVLLSVIVFLFFYKNEFEKLEILSGIGEIGRKWHKNAPDGQFEKVEILAGQKTNPLRGPVNGKIHNVAYYANGSVIYDINYTYDQFGRRISENPISKSKNKFAVFFGCSDLLGVGVSAENTIPLQFEQMDNDYKGYNYGFVGVGAHYVLRLLETTDFNKELPEDEGYFFYVMTEGHYPKTIGRAFTLIRPVMPVYELKDDKAHYVSTLEEKNFITTWIKKYLAGSHLGVLAGGTFITEGMRYRKQERDLICQILQQSKEQAEKLKPKSKFVIVLHTLLPRDDRERIIACADSKKIDYINIDVPYKDEFVTDPVYFHPSKVVNKLVADRIQDFITKSKN